MTEESDVPLGRATETGNVLVLQDHFVIERDPDVVAVHQDLLAIPFTDGTEVSALGGNKLVKRSVVLGLLEVLIPLRGIVEDLAFETSPMWLAFKRTTQGESIVGESLGQALAT